MSTSRYLPLSLATLRPLGDHARRLQLNLRRLQDPLFKFDAMMTAFTVEDAPGDWVGRTLLSLCLHEQLSGEACPAVDEILHRLPEYFNRKGYLGPDLPAGEVDEGQLAGHSFLLRGLSEAWKWRRDPRAGQMLAGICDQLYAPAASAMPEYPLEYLQTLEGRFLVGTVVGHHGRWHRLLSDIGCVFLSLDGATQAYSIHRSEGLRHFVETTLARFSEADALSIGFQTHSFLTALRGVLRWWRDVDPSPQWLDLVIRGHDLYLRNARTEHHANYNWFGRPDWTEACGVVDAFQLAIQLWSATGRVSYLEEARLVWYNALLHGQRSNGGFGCDLCPGPAGHEEVGPHEYYEAPWCCSMRGTEGLARGLQAGWFREQENGLVIPFPLSSEVSLLGSDGDGTASFRLECGLPELGEIQLTILQLSQTLPSRFRILLPQWTARETLQCETTGAGEVTIDAQAGAVDWSGDWREGDQLKLKFPIPLRQVPALHENVQQNKIRQMRGDLILGIPVNSPAGTEPAPVPSPLEHSEEMARILRTRILLPTPG